VDPPDRELDPLFVQRFPPGQDVLVDAVNQRSIEIEQNTLSIRIGCNPDGSRQLVSVWAVAGFTRSYADKLEAEEAAKRVAGVVGVANDIEVRLPALDQRPDPEIARDAIAAIKSRLPLVAEQIKVVVRNGWITLEGEVEWDYQRSAAEGAVRRVKGLKGVTNTIQVKQRVPASEIKRRIEEAFRRTAEIDANRIAVEAHEGEVVLKGTVRSWAEREEAERAAWLAPGVVRVDNRIVVSP
jgi:osmotically-inducible protein OsmY